MRPSPVKIGPLSVRLFDASPSLILRPSVLIDLPNESILTFQQQIHTPYKHIHTTNASLRDESTYTHAQTYKNTCIPRTHSYPIQTYIYINTHSTTIVARWRYIYTHTQPYMNTYISTTNTYPIQTHTCIHTHNRWTVARWRWKYIHTQTHVHEYLLTHNKCVPHTKIFAYIHTTGRSSRDECTHRQGWKPASRRYYVTSLMSGSWHTHDTHITHAWHTHYTHITHTSHTHHTHITHTWSSHATRTKTCKWDRTKQSRKTPNWTSHDLIHLYESVIVGCVVPHVCMDRVTRTQNTDSVTQIKQNELSHVTTWMSKCNVNKKKTELNKASNDLIHVRESEKELKLQLQKQRAEYDTKVEIYIRIHIYGFVCMYVRMYIFIHVSKHTHENA